VKTHVHSWTLPAALAIVLAIAPGAGAIDVPAQDIAFLDGSPYASSLIGGGAYTSHQIPHLNDGLYGNTQSWIPSTVASYAGITFPGACRIDAVALGRDSGGEATSYTDRVPMNFTIQGQAGGGGFGVQRTVTGRTTPTRLQYDFLRTGVPGTNRVFVADDVRVNITATNTGNQPCIDELEIYGRPTVVPGPTGPDPNLARQVGATAFASSVLGGYAAHTIPHLNDGLYGNSFSWIPASAGAEFAGVSLPAPGRIRAIAFGRDNTDTNIDRVAPGYTIEYTTDASTNYATDPGVTWLPAGVVDRNYAPGGGTVRANFAGRMQYDAPSPALASAVRVLSNGVQVCIDELELLGDLGPTSVPSDDIALKGTAYASSVLAGGAYPIHQTAHLNDGIYGNNNSWISNEFNAGIAGIALDGTYRIDAVALGRSNSGPNADRVPSDFTIEGAIGAGAFTVQQAVTGRNQPKRLQYDFIAGTGSPTFAADKVQVNITDVLPPNQPCIDELEIYGRPAQVMSGAGPLANLAQRPGATAFVSSTIGGYPDRHSLGGLTDGQYGNMNSWIAAGSGAEHFGVSFDSPVHGLAIAFGRDNTDTYTDRVHTAYTIQATNVVSSNYNDPTIPWTTLAVVDRNYAPGFGAVRPNFAGRMQYDSPIGPTEVTAVRVVTNGPALGNPQICIDELEVIGYSPPADNIATRGTAYASSVLAGGAHATHQIPHLNDGMYSNAHSWISDEVNDGTAGIALDQAYRIDAVALGRDATGIYGDRVPSNFTIEGSLGGGGFVTRQAVAGRTDPARVQYDFINGPGSGQISTWTADHVQVNVSAVTSVNQPCIDELEIYGRPVNVPGYNAATKGGNLAQMPGASPLASSVVPGWPDRHTIPGLTDGQYGNMNSWIPAGSTNEHGGVDFGTNAPVYVGQVAFGRDNTDFYKDRVAGSYQIEYTLDDPADPSARWRVRDTVGRDYAPGGGTVRPGFAGRMAYDVGQMPARGVRVSFSGAQACIDEIETIGSAAVGPESFQLLTGSAAAASSQHSSGLYPTSALNDGIQGGSGLGPYWNDNTHGAPGDWARLTWDETQLVRYVNLRTPILTHALGTRTLDGVKVQYLRPGGNPNSNNDWLDYDAARTIVAPHTSESNPNPNYYSDNAPLITRGVRAYFTTGGNNGGRDWNWLDEVQAFGSTNIARTRGTPFASSQHGSGLYPLTALNDGIQTGNSAPGIPFGYWNDNTQWQYPDWAGILLDAEWYVDGVNLRTPIVNLGDGARVVDDVSLEYLALGGDPNSPADWMTLIDAFTLVAPTTNDGTQDNFFTFAPIHTAGIRAYFGPGSGNDGGWNYLDEIEVFGHVPEPTSLLLVAGGLLALVRRRARRR